jgi:hypothetical protein
MKKFALLNNYIVGGSEKKLIEKGAFIIPREFWGCLTDSRMETYELMIWTNDNYVPVFIGSDFFDVFKSIIDANNKIIEIQKKLEIEEGDFFSGYFDQSLTDLWSSFDILAEMLAYPKIQAKVKEIYED